MSNGIAKETYEKADPETRDNFIIDLQFETHKAVTELKDVVVPLKIDVKWLTWGFRLLVVSIIGLSLYILRIGIT